MEYSCLMERAEEFYREVALEYYNNFAGLSERFALVEIVQKYPELFDEATYRDAMALTDAQLDSYELRELKSFVTGNLFTAELKELVEAKEQKEAALTVEYEGESVAYRSMPVKVANEPDAARRREMDVKLRGALSGELNPFYVQMSDKTFEITERLGYANYTEMTKQLLGLKLEELRESLLALIADTWELYVARLEEYAGSRLGLSPSQLEQCDVGYLFRASQFDDLFPAERMVPALTTTLAGMGIDLDKQENVTLDLEKRPKKSPRAFCIGIEVPQDVRLVLSPIGGLPAELVTFYQTGELHRVFPVDGMISGFWTEEEERVMNIPLSFDLGFTAFTAMLSALCFYKSGDIRSITLYPGETVSMQTPLGSAGVRHGFSLYESGSLRSFEPASPMVIQTPIGRVVAYDPLGVGVTADSGSVVLSESGELLELKTTANRILVQAPGESPVWLSPVQIPHPCSDEAPYYQPLRLQFGPDTVTITDTRPHTWSTKDCRFSVSAFSADPFGCSPADCASCSFCKK